MKMKKKIIKLISMIMPNKIKTNKVIKRDMLENYPNLK